VHKPSQPLQQVVRRLLERRKFLSTISDENKCVDTAGVVISSPNGEHHASFVPSGFGVCQQFKCVTVKGVLLSCSTGNNYATIGSDVVLIRNILKQNCNLFVVYQKFCHYQDFFTYPLSSSQVGI
jgi:hypothetical protein